MGLIDRLNVFSSIRQHLKGKIARALEEVSQIPEVTDITYVRPLVGHGKEEPSIKLIEHGKFMSVYLYTKDKLGRGAGYVAQITYDGTKAAASEIRKYVSRINWNGGDHTLSFA